MEKGQKCVYCFTVLRLGARKCHACGEWIQANDTIEIGVEEPTQKKDNLKTSTLSSLDTGGAVVYGSNSKQDWIIGISITMFFVLTFGAGFGIWYFWSEIQEIIPKKDAYNYACNTSKQLEHEYNKSFSIRCNGDTSKIKIQYKDKDIMIIDGEELLDKCGKNTICDKENRIQLMGNSGTGGFIIENNTISKAPNLYILSFVNKPSDALKIQSLKNIFEIYTLTFGDSVYIDILGSTSDPLMLRYSLPPISIEVFNLEKNHKKTFTLGIGSAKENAQEFSYEKLLSFFNKSQFEEHLNTYLSEIKTTHHDSIVVFDHIKNIFEKLRNEKFSNKYFTLSINSYPIFPTIGYGRELNEWSCNDWKNMAIRYNNDVDARYTKCWNSGAKGCKKGSKISGTLIDFV